MFKIYDLKYKEIEGDDDEFDKEDESNIIKGGDKMKYYILLIIGINTIVNIFIEWFVMKLINNCYEDKVIENYKKEVEEEKIQEAKYKSENKDNEYNDKEVQIFKHQRIYYYDKRKKIKEEINIDIKEEKSDDVKIYLNSQAIKIISK